MGGKGGVGLRTLPHHRFGVNFLKLNNLEERGRVRILAFLGAHGITLRPRRKSRKPVAVLDLASTVFQIPQQGSLWALSRAIDALGLNRRRLLARRFLSSRTIARPSSAAKSEQDIRDFYVSWEWQRLSYETKIARGRRCECCGARAPEVRIVTDHVKPLRWYWSLRLDATNLQVLCDDCNRGKSSRYHHDFRTD